MSNKPIADRYLIIHKCGEGAYAKVYFAEDLQNNNTPVAIKKLKSNSIEEGVQVSSLREISLLKELKHINIVKLIDVIHLSTNIILAFEYVESDLKRLLKNNKNKGFEKKIYKSLLYQLLKGFEFIHKKKIIHRDLKSDNILITNDYIIKIADFGLARGFGLPISNFRNDVVSLWYRAPDILLGNGNYETSVDLWSIGCIFAEMVNGNVIFKGYTEKEQIRKIFSMLGTPDVDKKYPMYKKYSKWNDEDWEIYSPLNFREIVPNLDNNGIDLLKKFLEYDPEKRISASEALKHPFFNDLDERVKKMYE